ncbi:response regulator transcription factor [Paenibacillus cymbidii]|uniref:response regulator transcription factor n=1 Tax=Paenibacillus cymbidii TaxID=1639034 RepID=UPI001081FFC9|nr:response regulator transcription factor [Paenibacillus cymbidii]
MKPRATCRLLIVEDHPLMAQATQQLLTKLEWLDIVGIAGNGKSCLEMVEQFRPDIVLLDFQLPDMSGRDVTEQIKVQYPETHVVIFTGKDVGDLFNKLADLQISGIMSKEASEAMLVRLIESLREGATVVPLSLFHRMRLGDAAYQADPVLTPDELNIMGMVLGGMTHEQISEQIYTSKRSVDNYLKKIYDKFGVSSKAQAIERFIHSKYYAGYMSQAAGRPAPARNGKGERRDDDF